MGFMREEKEGCALIKLDGPMGINEAAALRDEMVECFETYNDIIIDMEAASECDASGMQLLYSARLEASKTGKRFLVTNASMSLMDAIVRAGLDPDAIFCAGDEG